MNVVEKRLAELINKRKKLKEEIIELKKTLAKKEEELKKLDIMICGNQGHDFSNWKNDFDEIGDIYTYRECKKCKTLEIKWK